MYEFKCEKCNTKIEYYLKLNYCKCGGDLKRIDKPYKYSDIVGSSPWAKPVKQSKEFVPVRKINGKVWYYRRKRVKKV